MRIVTIGGYGFTEEGFVRALRKAGVDAFVDIRKRRSVRGAKYAFLNSSRLQLLLSSIGISYIHALELAPTTSVRKAQWDDDRATGITKRRRTQLSSSFIQKYRSEILGPFAVEPLRTELNGATVVAFFCVEGSPSACHRSLAAEHLVRTLGGNEPVEHLVP